MLAASCFLASAEARADTCGELHLDDEPQEVILGEFGPINYTHPLGEWVAPTNTLGVCWRDVGGGWNLDQIPGCDTSTPASDTFILTTGGGDDYVAPLLPWESVSAYGLNWLRARLYAGWIQTKAMRCDHEAIAPWNGDFSFGVTAAMGTGADEFHGTWNDDYAASNYVSTEWSRVPAGVGPLRPTFYAPADDSLDMLCGGAGDDELLGDADDHWQSGREEHLDGGSGDDVCDGDPPNGFLGGTPGGSSSDVATSSCETVEHAYSHDGFFSCEDTANPILALGL